MVNNTTLSISEASSLILSGPYLLWLEKDVFPYIYGTFCLLAIVLGLTFNIAICKLFKSEEQSGVKRMINQFMAFDIIADVFVLAPGAYLSFSKQGYLPDVYCMINGIFNLTTFLIQFGILSLGLAMSSVTLAKLQVRKEKINICKHLSFIICVSFGSFILALVPVTWNDGYVYKTNEYQCGPNKFIEKTYIHVVFSLSVFLSLILTCIISVMLIKRLSSQNAKVCELTHANSEETVIMDDQTRSTDRCAEEGDGVKPNTIKSNVTVSIEDQTKSYGKLNEHEHEEINRFQSNVTISMEDQTKTYAKHPFRSSTQTGVTVSMEDQTRSYGKSFKSSATGSTNSSDISEFGQPRELIVSCLPEIDSFGALPLTTCGISYGDSTVGPKHLKQSACGTTSATSFDGCNDSASMTDSDEEVSFDGSCGPGILSRAASKSSLPSSVRSEIQRPKAFKRENGQLQKESKNLLSNILHSTMTNKNKTFQLAAIYTVVSWTVLACWSPFVIMVYIDMYGNSWWGGWFTIAGLCGNLSYCIKPMLILGIRGQLLKATKAVLPKSVKNRADHITSAVTQAMDKVKKFSRFVRRPTYSRKE